MKVGFIGAGKIVQALAYGFIESGLIKCENIIASCTPEDEKYSQRIVDIGSILTLKNEEVVKWSDTIICAVKPNVASNVIDEIRPYFTNNKLFVSLMMGVTLNSIQKKLNQSAKIIRIMPNAAVSVRQGTSVFTANERATSADISSIRTLLEAVGSCDEIPEYLFDAVTAVSGSGPAYLYLFAEAMADGAVRMGMPRELAYRLTAQTIAGSGHMILENRMHSAQLKDMVMSPAGSTAEAIFHIEKNGVRGAIMQAIEEATNKSYQISKNELS